MEVHSLIVRCERCSTTYELDESLLEAEGSEVECARCHHVFTVRSPQAAGQTLLGIPPPPPSEGVEREVPRAPPPATAARAEPTRAQTPAQTPRPSIRVAPPRSGPAVYRPGGIPAASVQPGGARAPLLRRDTVGAFESRLRWSHRWRWLAPLLLLVLVAAGAGAYLVRRGHPSKDMDRVRAQALELAQRDDVASLEEAGAQLEGAMKVAPGLSAIAADRALVDLLLAGALAEGARGPEVPEKARDLASQATEMLDRLEKDGAAAAEVARARVVAAALGQDRAAVARLAAAARSRLPDDPQVELAERGAEVHAADRSVRDRAVGTLGMLVARRPELLRARYLLARGQGAEGKRAEALATLEGLLRANPQHEGAMALRAELTATAKPAAPPPSAPPPATAGSPPAVKEEKGLVRRPTAPGEAAVPPAAAAAPSPSLGRSPAPAAPASAVGGGEAADRPAADGESGPLPARLHPAAVPDPEPVQGGG